MTEHELDEILTHHWPLVLRATMAGTDEWLKGFAKSVARQAKRPSWRPTARQAQIMRRLVSEMGTAPENNMEVIEP
jgi:hypothetical protein